MARDEGAKAFVLAVHANPWEEEDDHETWNNAFLEQAVDFAKQVLLIHGDSHDFLIDHPFADEDDRSIETITRPEVYGYEQVQAVRITVIPDDPVIFGFKPLFVPGNIVELTPN